MARIWQNTGDASLRRPAVQVTAAHGTGWTGLIRVSIGNDELDSDAPVQAAVDALVSHFEAGGATVAVTQPGYLGREYVEEPAP